MKTAVIQPFPIPSPLGGMEPFTMPFSNTLMRWEVHTYDKISYPNIPS